MSKLILCLDITDMNFNLGSFSEEDLVTNLATYFVLYEIVPDYKHYLLLFTNFEELLAAKQYGL